MRSIVLRLAAVLGIALLLPAAAPAAPRVAGLAVSPSGTPPAEPRGACGLDPTGDALDCGAFAGCA